MELLRTLLSHLPGMAYRCAVEAPWTMEFTSAGAEELTGYPPDDFMSGRVTWEDITHPDDLDALARQIKSAVAEHRRYTLTYRICHRSGAERWVLERGEAVYDQAGTPVALEGFISDISEQKQVEQRLRESEEHYRHTVEYLPHMPWVADPDGAVTLPNPQWADRTGRRYNEALGSGWLATVHPDDQERAIEAVARSRDTGAPYTATYRVRMADGSYRWVLSQAHPRRDGTGRIIRWYGINTDIDEQVRAEERRRESEEELRHALDLSPQAHWTADAEGRVIFASARWCELTGSELSEELNDGWMRTQHPEDLPAIAEARERATRTGIYEVEHRLLHAAGEYRWMRSYARPRRDSTGEIVKWYGTTEDIHDHRVAEAELRKSEQRYRAVFEQAAVGIAQTSLDGRWIEVNPALCRMLGYAEEELLGRVFSDFTHPDDRTREEKLIQALDAGEIPSFHHDKRYLCKDGSEAWSSVTASLVRGDVGQPVNRIAIVRDIGGRKAAEERLRWSATHDPLTHLPNRALLQERMAQAVAEAQGTGSRAGLLLVDMDDFKQVNDTLGHDAGDQVLKEVARRLREAAPVSATVARLGGDEFAVVLPETEDEQALSRIAEGILASMREALTYEGRLLDCRASIGASSYPDHGKTADDLLKSADIALYTAKSADCGRVAVFRPEMRAGLQERASMLELARTAVRDNLIRPFYQPKVDLASRRIAGFEALLRWHHPRNGTQSPGTIAAAFEDLEIAEAMSELILTQTVADIRRWLDQGVEFGHVAINAAAAEFRRDGFAERVLDELHRADVPAEHLQVEVTETVFLGHGADHVRRALALLSSSGVMIALDDFGTGYASLAHLRQFPVHAIKIDRSFVQDLAQNTPIVRSVIGLGQGLGIQVIAEGIETPAQEAALRRLGCAQGQGYLYSEAVPGQVVPDMLAAWDWRDPLRSPGR